MKEEIYNILKQVQNGELSIGDAQSQLLRLFDVSNQRELLFAFLKANENQTIPDYDSNKHLMIDAFLGKQ